MQESVKGSEKAGFGQLFLFQNLNLKKTTGLPPRSSAPQRFKALPPAPPYPATFGPRTSSSPLRHFRPCASSPRSTNFSHRASSPPLRHFRPLRFIVPPWAQRLIVPTRHFQPHAYAASAAPASSASHSSTTPPSALRFITPPRHFLFMCFPELSATFPASEPVRLQITTEDQYDSERSPFHEHRSITASFLIPAACHSTSFTVIHITISSSHCPQPLPQHDTCTFEAT